MSALAWLMNWPKSVVPIEAPPFSSVQKVSSVGPGISSRLARGAGL